MDTIEVFCSCAPEERKYLDELVLHLKLLEAQSPVTLWDSSSMLAGTEWEIEHDQHLNSAQVILFLISAPFLASSFHQQEIEQAQSLRDQRNVAVIPILLRPVSLQGTRLGQLQCLPYNDKPIVLWRHREEAFVEITDEINRVVWSYFLENETPPEQHPPSTVSKRPRRSAGQTTFDFMTVIVDPKIALFHARELRHKRAWNRLQRPTIAVAGLAWFFALSDTLSWTFNAPLLLQTIFKILLMFSITAAIICILTLLLYRSYSLIRSQYYQLRKKELSDEKKMYQANQGIYALLPDPQRIFMERISQITQNVGDGTRSTDETRDYFSPDAQH